MVREPQPGDMLETSESGAPEVEVGERDSEVSGRDLPRTLTGRKSLILHENWLGGRDSNPDNVVQSHVSYR